MKLNTPYIKLILLLVSYLIFANPSGFQAATLGIKTENSTIATIVGEDGLIMRTDNGGVNWVQQPTNITNIINAIDYVNYVNAQNETVKLKIAVCENGVILRSTNDGNLWSVILSGSTNNLNDVAVFSPGLIYICGDNGTLLRSTNTGETWQSVNIKRSINLNHITLLDPSLSSNVISAVVAGDNGLCIATINLKDWFSLGTPVTDNIISAASKDDILLCGTVNGNILRSTNRGTNWVTVQSVISGSIFALNFISSGTLVGSGENGQIIRSTNSGTSWVTVSTSVKTDLMAMDFGSETFGIATGGYGSEIYTTDGGLTWSETPNVPLNRITAEVPVKLNQNYPNPFNPSTVISYELSDNSSVTLKVYDMKGSEVSTLVNSYQSKGIYNVKFNASELSSGIYFYVLKLQNGSSELSKTMRMILTK